MTATIPDTDDDQVCVLLTVSSARIARTALGNVSGFNSQHLADARLELERADSADHDKHDVMRFWFDPEVAKVLPAALGQYGLKRRKSNTGRTFQLHKEIAMSVEDQIIRQAVVPW